MKGETYNYTVLVWQDGSSQPCHTEGPFPVASCEDLLDVTVYGLRRSQHYTAAVVAYNDHLSLRSKRVDVCESLFHSCWLIVPHCQRCVRLPGAYMRLGID